MIRTSRFRSFSYASLLAVATPLTAVQALPDPEDDEDEDEAGDGEDDGDNE